MAWHGHLLAGHPPLHFSSLNIGLDHNPRGLLRKTITQASVYSMCRAGMLSPSPEMTQICLGGLELRAGLYSRPGGSYFLEHPNSMSIFLLCAQLLHQLLLSLVQIFTAYCSALLSHLPSPWGERMEMMARLPCFCRAAFVSPWQRLEQYSFLTAISTVPCDL